MNYNINNPIYSTLLYETGWEFLQDTLGVSVNDVIVDDPFSHLTELHRVLRENNEDINVNLSHYYNVDDIIEFTDFINDFDEQEFYQVIFDNHKLNMIKNIDTNTGDSFSTFIDVDNSTGLIVTKNNDYINYLSIYDIEFSPLGFDWYILNTETVSILGVGYNGISLVSNTNDSVIKVTQSEEEFVKSNYLKSISNSTEEEIIFKQHFCEIYETYELDDYLFIIEREYITGDSIWNEDDDLFETEEYKTFENILENDEVSYWNNRNSNFWDIHTGNLIANPSGKEVSFIYFDY